VRKNKKNTCKSTGVVTVSSLLNGLEEDAVTVAKEVSCIDVLEVLWALNEGNSFVESVSRLLRLSVEPWDSSHQELGKGCHIIVEEQNELALELLVVDAVVEITSLKFEENRVSEEFRM